MIWGFLSDTYGRKRLLVIGYLLDAFFALIAGLTQTFPMLLFAKFMGGFIINGPFAVLTTILSEFHCARYRARVVLFMGIIFSTANVLLPLISWALLPNPIELKFFDGAFVMHTWNFYLLLGGLPSLISGICHMFLPESPKFLMTAGRNEEAMAVFQKVYSMNTGNPPETYPVKALIEETANGVETNRLQAFKNGFTHMKPLFLKPHLPRIILVCAIQFGTMLGLNTLRLWLPQLFTAMADYETLHPSQEASICEMLDMVKPNVTETGMGECFVNYNMDSVYINAIIVASVSILGYSFVGNLLTVLGKKRVLIMLGFICGVLGISIYFAQNSPAMISMSSIMIALAGINTNVILTVIVDLFPTSLRTMAVALSMMTGRLGAMVGNAIFPHLISVGCLPPFLFIGLGTLSSAVLGFLLPKTDMKPLE
ncbi:PREDICTED: synaptic vesicle glycoprotein 2B-like [Nicrophorus vespilloides]|uniref:Synaptic vesicle glycoprotein 2B-like n=1 Tax=Nicrophorus vespilloides TaxID=110193 RepID=A0ABM1MGS5_NICVS|nr:PREDICTED: synaptic vesicle glycoprotein 2B-like [Nicrophorus vespilloides]